MGWRVWDKITLTQQSINCSSIYERGIAVGLVDFSLNAVHHYYIYLYYNIDSSSIANVHNNINWGCQPVEHIGFPMYRVMVTTQIY